ncbi:glycosyltransferase family 2 protein [Aquimarina sp. 2201CG14-23]|uniref:glycosyltransferase family 2 protein n=1 Tax=Aquimarina mycalae TaxID=3040073 RepID=UPI002477D95E|nr:glycosyltransferase [Aquimarina sp. 2201CG14-23]MDH7444980.1 glycosyltransferase [Aquimarina sp. 2201CG14-23]
MLSILIPVYNYKVIPLVEEIHTQVSSCNITFEIIVFDDGSHQYLEENLSINSISSSRFKKLSKNVGRSVIRNALAAEAKYEFLLFLDADIEPVSELFIKKYLDSINSDTEIISGGLLYKNTKPTKEQILRWKYGHLKESVPVEKRKKKPYLSFLSSNFLIRKSIFDKNRFNEEILNLACEDTIFALDAKSKKIRIEHIDNPVFHLGLETSSVFLKKSLDSVEVRRSLIHKNLLKPKDTRITHLAHIVKKIRLQGLIIIIHTLTKKIFVKNLISNNPSLLIFDLFRLGHYFYRPKENES